MPELRTKTPAEIAELRERSLAQQRVVQDTHSVCNRLDADRLRVIAENAENGNQQVLAGCCSPLELHAFASNWNCDRGVEVLMEIVRNPNCDAGTALWLYWENDPYFYCQYASASDAKGNEERLMCDVMRTIESRILANDFATCDIPFDPTAWVESKYDDAAWVKHKIPQPMYNPIPRG